MPTGIYERKINPIINLGNFSRKGVHPITEFKKGHHSKTEFKKGHKSNLGKHWKVKDTSNMNNRIGERHPRWIKDRSLIKHQKERNNPEYKQWRYKVFKRDRHICKINNQYCRGKIKAHHILGWSAYPELRYNINNGITLCQAHHPRKRAEEKRLIPFFQGLVPVLNV